MSNFTENVTQHVGGAGNIFSGTGDVYVIREPSPLPLEEVETRKNLRILLNKVKTFWIQGVLERSVHAAALLDLGKRINTEMVDHPWRMVLELPEQGNQVLPPNTKIIDIFDEMNRALLILGDPGSGKTITLIELAREFITLVETDETFGRPIPVIFNLSTWGEKQQRLSDWIVAELSVKYQIPERIGRSWLENYRILPLLDGLDEVRRESGAACVEAINTFAETHGLAGLAVCCRLQEYLDLPVRLKLNGAISLQPLTREQVDRYLAAGGNKLKGLRAALRADTDLQSLAQTPLILSIMSLAYQDLSDESLTEAGHGTLEERRVRLFDTYIERMFKRRGQTASPYTSEQTRRWLAWLAQRMIRHNQTIFLIDQLQPSWLSTRIQRWCYVLVSRMIGGLIIGLSSVLLWDVSPYTLLGSGIVGLVGGLSVGVVDALRLDRSTKIVEVEETFTLLRSAINVLGLILIVGLIVGLMVGLMGGLLMTGLFEPSLIMGLLFGLIFGLIFGLVFGLRGSRQRITKDIQTVEVLSLSWSGALRGSVLGLIVGLIFWLAITLIAVLMGEQTNSPIEGLLDIMAVLGLVGFAIGLLSRSTVETKTSANQGIRLSIRNAVLAGLIVWLIVGLILGLISGLSAGLEIGYMAGLLAALWSGGLDVIQHYILRLSLYLRRHTPRNYVHFLDYAAERVFLQKVGGGYTFIHRLLVEHFAKIES